MPHYDNKIGRLRVEVNANGARDHSYAHGAAIDCPDGWNDSCQVQRHTLSVEELRDLHYLLGRAIAVAES